MHRRSLSTPGLDSGVDALLCHRTPKGTVLEPWEVGRTLLVTQRLQWQAFRGAQLLLPGHRGDAVFVGQRRIGHLRGETGDALVVGLVAQAQDLAGRVKAGQLLVADAEAEFTRIAGSIQNIVIDGVPAGGEDDFVTLKHVGEKPSFDPTLFPNGPRCMSIASSSSPIAR